MPDRVTRQRLLMGGIPAVLSLVPIPTPVAVETRVYCDGCKRPAELHEFMSWCECGGRISGHDG